MEATDWEFFGEQNRPSGYSSVFNDYKYFKKRCRAFIVKIRNRVNDVVTNDMSLNELLLGDLIFLEEEVKSISEKILMR